VRIPGVATTPAIRVIGVVVRSRALRRALIAFFWFNAAEWGTWIAMLVYAYGRGGVGASGLVAVIQLVPAALFAPFASTIGDRMPHRRALAIGYLAQSGTMGMTAAALATRAPLPLIYAAAALTACCVTLSRPSHNAALPSLAQTPDELTAANALSGTATAAAYFVGPILTGLMLDASGPALVFGVMAAGHLGGGILVATAPAPDERSRPTPGGFHRSELLEGFRALRENADAMLLVSFVAGVFVVVGMLDVLSVVLAFDVLGLGPAGPSTIASALGVGSVVGAAASIWLVGRARLAPAIALGLAGLGLPLAAVGTVRFPLEAWVLVALSGIGWSFFDVASRTLLQRSVAEDVLSRVFGLQEGLTMAAFAVGSALVPALVKALGPSGAFVAAGAVLPILGLAGWGRIRRIDATATPPGPDLDLLRSVEIFAPLAPPVLERLSNRLEPLHASAGTVVIRQGDPGDRFYVVRSGEAEVTIDGKAVGRLGPGGAFGEVALLRNVPRTATVTATTDTDLVSLVREDFLGAVTWSRGSSEAANRMIDRRLGGSDVDGS
jgi:MFS family permease